MPLPLRQAQAINELASLLHGLLPNRPHPYADQSISFAGVAHDLQVTRFYRAGSKLTTVTALLAGTLEHEPRTFCPLILEIVRRALVYRNNKGQPLHREDLEAVNQAVAGVGFKVPDLWDPAFLESLPRRSSPPVPKAIVTRQSLEELKAQLLAIGNLGEHQRGPGFERFLQSLFHQLKLDPKGSIRLVGEQIDGSFNLDGQTYLLEAKFHSRPVGPGVLREFRDKVEAKAAWSRGLVISWSGFSPDAPDALARGKSTNIIGMSGQDLFFVLDGQVTLHNAIRLKARRAAETGEALVPLQQLLLESEN